MENQQSPTLRAVDPSKLAREYRAEVRAGLQRLGRPVKLCGFLSSEAPRPSRTYARYTRRGCEDVGITFELREVPRLELEAAILEANADPEVHGLLVYYPVFGTQQDSWVKDLIDPGKDVEGLCTTWLRRLYENVRTDTHDPRKKAVLPCTPLAILKLLQDAGLHGSGPMPLAGRTISVFNRSEVVGRPLAAMLSNDGARVLSFDVHGPVEMRGKETLETTVERAEALALSDAIITGVPSRHFEVIRAAELRDDQLCLNFSTVRNFSKEAEQRAGVFIPRVGPVTVAMVLRNTLRLFRNTRLEDPGLKESSRLDIPPPTH